MADGQLRDADICWLEAGEEDGFGYFGGLHHVGAADVLFGAAFADGELGFDSAGEDGSDLDAVLAEFGVEGLREAGLGEFRGAVDGFACNALEAGYGGDEENGAAFWAIMCGAA